MTSSPENATELMLKIDSIEHQLRSINAFRDRTSNYAQETITEAERIIRETTEKIKEMLPFSEMEQNIMNKKIEKDLSYPNHQESPYSQQVFKTLLETLKSD